MEADISLTRIVLSLLLVAGLIGLSALALKWLTDKSIHLRQLGTDRRLKLKESISLDHKHKAFLLAVDAQEYLLVSNGTHITQLSHMPRTAQEAEHAS